MPEIKQCKYCHITFEGRTNQEFCSNAHKTAFFRLRSKRDITHLASIQKPIYFPFFYPLTFHERNYPQACKELNLIYNTLEVIKEALGMQGAWGYGEFREYFKEISKSYHSLSKTIKEKIKNNEYSLTFTQFMGRNLLQTTRIYKQVATKMRSVMRSFAGKDNSADIEVKLEDEFIQKMEKLREKYTKLWLAYKENYLR